MRRSLIAVLAIAGTQFAAAAENPAAPEEKLAKAVLFQHLANDVLLPLSESFQAKANALAMTAQAFCANPRSANLAAIQAAWKDAQAAWQPLEMLQIGPIIDRRTQRQVNAWPVRPTLIEPLLKSGQPVSAEQVERLGVSGKGLPAMEYLLFPTGKSSSQVQSELAGQRCTVLKALASQVAAEAQGLAGDWREPNGGFLRQLAEAGQHPQDGIFSTADQALSDVANLLIAGLDGVKVRKLGKLLDKRSGTVDLERIESWRSGTTIDNIRKNLQGFEVAFFGAGKDGVGLDDYLAGIGRPVLPQLVREELELAKSAADAITEPMPRALKSQRKQVQALHKAVTQLQSRMENEIAGALKVDLGFNANDGD